MEYQLTDFQSNILSQLMGARIKAQQDEAEFVNLCFKASGITPPEGVAIEFKDKKLSWSEPTVEPK